MSERESERERKRETERDRESEVTEGKDRDLFQNNSERYRLKQFIRN